MAGTLFPIVLMLAVALAAQSMIDSTWLNLINEAAIAALAVTALNLVMGHTGLVSIGNAAFMAVGALTAAELAIYCAVPFPLAVLSGGLAAAACSVVVALPALRIKGLYLVAGTLAFHFVVLAIVKRLQIHQVGAAGFAMPLANVFGFDLVTPRDWCLVLLALLGLWLSYYRTLLLSKPGRAWRAIREDPTVAAISGIATRRYQIVAFVLSAAVIGAAGALSAFYIGSTSYDAFTLQLAISQLAMVIVGGMGSIYGPVAGAVLLTLLPKIIQSGGDAAGVPTDNGNLFLVEGAVVGMVFVGVILIAPRGLSSIAPRRLAFWDRARSS